MNTSSVNVDEILQTADSLRWQIGRNLHDNLMQDLYTDAARIADRAVVRPDDKPRFDLDRAIDRIVTSRIWGFPMMIILFTIVFWITISGANVPSDWLAFILLDTVRPLLHQGAAAISL
ncbi:MAG: ferrous iron transporter B, partial [Anaerolineae bacterium]